MTPIRVRGKRNATVGEKWHAGKKRKVIREASPASSTGKSTASSTQVGRAKRRKRKPYDPSLSRLEQLPTEILQEIFAYHPNPNLPAASPRLLAQLSSQHVYLSVTSRVLEPILDFKEGNTASRAELDAATRLLNSRFMTWDFFAKWLQAQYDERMPVPSIPAQGPYDYYRRIWFSLKPSKELLPPKKLLTGPWTAENTMFFRIVAFGMADIVGRDAVYGELAYEGLRRAITDGVSDAVLSLLAMDLRPSTDLLRQAVIDCGCLRDIVDLLVHKCMQDHRLDWREAEASAGQVVKPGAIQAGIDFFDHSLWAWADKARACGDEKGDWLIDLLRKKGRAVGGQAAVWMSPKP